VLSKASETQLERASVAMKKELLDYFQNYKMLTDDIVISDGVVRTLDLVATLFIDKSNKRFIDAIQQKAADKLLEYFNVDNLAFGQKVSMADVNNFMLTVPEIRFFQVNNLPDEVYVNFNEIVQLNNFELSTELV
jgi:endo-beta-N-acetylglucosaminidase D